MTGLRQTARELQEGKVASCLTPEWAILEAFTNIGLKKLRIEPSLAQFNYLLARTTYSLDFVGRKWHVRCFPPYMPLFIVCVADAPPTLIRIKSFEKVKGWPTCPSNKN